MSGLQVRQVLQNIRKRRGELGYSQEYMAHRLGISQKGYSKLELDVSRLTVDRFLDICEILEMDPAEMISGAGA